MTSNQTGINRYQQKLDTTRIIHNKQVNDYFRGKPDIDDINTPNGKLRYDCLIEDGDSWATVQAAIHLFRSVIGYNFVIMADEFTGYPRSNLHESEAYLTQIVFSFKEKHSDYVVAQNKQGRKSQKRIQVKMLVPTLNGYVKTVSDAFINDLRNEINNNFPESFAHKTGTKRYSYTDRPERLDFTFNALNDTEAIEFARKICGIFDKTFEPNKCRKGERLEEPLIQEKVTVQGVQQSIPIYDSIVARVFLFKVELYIYGVRKPVTVVKRKL